MAKVIFSVGVKHPLYNKVVDATIITRNGGYNGKCIEAITNEEVYHPKDEKGIFVMNKCGDIVGYKERAAFSEKWQGWVEEIVEDDVPQCFDAHIFDFNTGKVIVENYGETQPYVKGEEFEPIEGIPHKIVCVSVIKNGVQVVFAVRSDLD
jgi:hypothetical protein